MKAGLHSHLAIDENSQRNNPTWWGSSHFENGWILLDSSLLGLMITII